MGGGKGEEVVEMGSRNGRIPFAVRHFLSCLPVVSIAS